MMKKKKRVSIIPLHGQIFSSESRKGGIYPDQVRIYFEEAIQHKSELVVLDINSPGGSPVGSTMIHNMILSLRETGIKVIAHCRDVCASGGYLIVSACDEIHAYKSSMIGSIGVIMSGFGFQDALKHHHVEYRELTAGENKAPVSPFKALDEDGKQFIEGMLADVHEDFIDIVYKSRPNEKMIENKTMITTAKVFTGKKAHEIGMIDGFKTIKLILEDLFGKDTKLKIHRPKAKESFIKKLISGHFAVEFSLKPFQLDQKIELK